MSVCSHSAQTPSEAKKNLGQLQAFNRLVIQVNLKGADPMKYRVVEKESFQAIGVKREFSLRNGENLSGIPKMWMELNQDGTMDYWIAAGSMQPVPGGVIAT